MGIATKSADLSSLKAQETTVDGIDFDGTSSNINYQNNWCRDLTASSDMTVSFWVKPDLVANEATYLIEAGAGGVTRQYILIEANASTQLRVSIRHSTNGASDGITYASSYGSITNGSWNHVVYSYRDSDNTLAMAINDVDQSASNAENGVNTFPGTATADTYVGTLNDTSNYYDGCLEQFYMTDRFFNVTSESVRRRFISDNSKPVFLPRGALVLLQGTASTWSNTGSTDLGTQTLDNITDCADSPSD